MIQGLGGRSLAAARVNPSHRMINLLGDVVGVWWCCKDVENIALNLGMGYLTMIRISNHFRLRFPESI